MALRSGRGAKGSESSYQGPWNYRAENLMLCIPWVHPPRCWLSKMSPSTGHPLQNHSLLVLPISCDTTQERLRQLKSQYLGISGCGRHSWKAPVVRGGVSFHVGSACKSVAL